MRTARTLEAEWRQVLQVSLNTGAKEDESSTGHVWAARFHHVTARSRLARVLELMNRLFFNFQFLGGHGKPRILKQWIRGHACSCVTLISNNLFHSFSNSFIIYLTSFSPLANMIWSSANRTNWRVLLLITVHIPEYCVPHVFKVSSWINLK
jgi:hypothetical protein